MWWAPPISPQRDCNIVLSPEMHESPYFFTVASYRVCCHTWIVANLLDEKWYQCGYNLHFSYYEYIWACFYSFSGHLYNLLWDVYPQFYPFFCILSLVFFFSLFRSSFIWVLNFYNHIMQMFPSFSCVFFYFAYDCFLCWFFPFKSFFIVM